MSMVTLWKSFVNYGKQRSRGQEMGSEDSRKAKQGLEMIDLCLKKRGLMERGSGENKGKRRYYYRDVSIV